jgi:hypothetical protein
MSLGRTLIILGLVLVAAGVLATLGARLPFRPGRLPGDIVYRSKHAVFYFPWVTSLLLSALLSFLVWLFRR